MPREPREWHEGACYHVMARGNRRGAIYRSSDDYELFLSLLKRVQRRMPFFLHSFCLMTNHFHLQFTTQDVPIWKIMQPLMNSYARIFNRNHGYCGHLFEARYVSKMIEDEIYFLEVSRYIHLNPVKATMVSEPLAYPYSSYRAYMETENAVGEELLDKSRVLQNFRSISREQYRLFVEGSFSHDEHERMIQTDMREDDNWLPWD